MIKPLTGHENCRGRPPNKGACREGPGNFIISVLPLQGYHKYGSDKLPADYTSLAVKRRWGEKATDRRPRDNIILTGSGYGISGPPEEPCNISVQLNKGLLHTGRMFPPWKPVKSRARDWVCITCSGGTNRKPRRHNHTCSSPQTITAAKKRHRWAMPDNEKKRGAI